MASSQTDQQTLTPGILSMLPLFYVGWSDSVLSPSEIDLIHKTLKSFSFLTEEEKNYLIKWTDPAHPPSDKIFKHWVETMRKKSKSLSEKKKNSLIDLGIEMALSKSSKSEYGVWTSSGTRLALKEIEHALGIQSDYSSKLLSSKLQDFPKEVKVSSSFETARMTFYLDGKYLTLRNRMRELLSDQFFDNSGQIEKDLYRLRILKQLKSLARQGLGSYAFPKKYGGFDRTGEHIAVFEMLSYGDLSLTVKFGVQFGLFGGAIYMLGTESHHRKYLEALSKAELLGCFAMTETGHGSNVKGLETQAVYLQETDEIEIHSPQEESGKDYIGNALHCQMAVVFAQLIVRGENHGIHAIMVPIRDNEGNLMPGIRIEDNGYKMGLNGVDNGRIWFHHVKVPRNHLLDKYGQITENGQYTSSVKNPSHRFFTMLGTLVSGRISVGLAANSTAKSALTIAIRYGLKRRQFELKDNAEETLLLDYPSHQSRLFPHLANVYAFHFALQELADTHVNNRPDEQRKIESLAAGLKAKSSWNCTEIVQECREACGGKGYLKDNGIPDLKADSDIFTTFEGDNTVLMQLVAKSWLTEFKQSFHEEGTRAVIRYLLTRFGNFMYSLNPIQTRNINTHHLLDREFHLHAFKYREKKILFSLSQRMRNYLQKRVDPGQAYLKCQNHMIALAHAIIDRIVLKSFVKGIENCPDESLKPILSKLCDLYALHTIHSQKGWYLENDYMNGTKSKAIRRLLAKVHQEIRPDAKALVDAFGIPDQMLNTEIGVE